mgnify:CR=1 FL=1
MADLLTVDARLTTVDGLRPGVKKDLIRRRRPAVGRRRARRAPRRRAADHARLSAHGPAAVERHDGGDELEVVAVNGDASAPIGV